MRQFTAGLQIGILGPLEILVDGEPLVTDTRKAPAILALLAVEGRAYARDELAALFWPESDDEAARGSLRRTLSALRAGLKNRWIAIDRAAHPGDILRQGLEGRALLRDVAAQPLQLFETGGQRRLVARQGGQVFR